MYYVCITGIGGELPPRAGQREKMFPVNRRSDDPERETGVENYFSGRSDVGVERDGGHGF